MLYATITHCFKSASNPPAQASRDLPGNRDARKTHQVTLPRREALHWLPRVQQILALKSESWHRIPPFEYAKERPETGCTMVSQRLRVQIIRKGNFTVFTPQRISATDIRPVTTDTLNQRHTWIKPRNIGGKLKARTSGPQRNSRPSTITSSAAHSSRG